MTATAESHSYTSVLWWADRTAPALGAVAERLLAIWGRTSELRRLRLTLDLAAGVRLTPAGREDVGRLRAGASPSCAAPRHDLPSPHDRARRRDDHRRLPLSRASWDSADAP